MYESCCECYASLWCTACSPCGACVMAARKAVRKRFLCEHKFVDIKCIFNTITFIYIILLGSLNIYFYNLL